MKRRRSLLVYARYAHYLLKEFRWPLGVFFIMLLGGGLIVHLFHEKQYTYGQACYQIFTMIMLQPADAFPQQWYLEVLYYVVPIAGLIVVADGLVRFGILLFQKKSRLKEWWVMEVSTYKDHIIVCGVGKVGYRIVRELSRLGESVVGIERAPDKLLTEELQDLGIPILVGEARLKVTLQEANVRQAAAVICATDNDLTNLDIALTAREINPAVRVVLRIFDDTLAQKFATEFKMPAISTSQTAAPVFVAAATGRSVFYSFQVDGTHVHIADLGITRGSALAGKTIHEIEVAHDVRVVFHSSGSSIDLKPTQEKKLEAGDTIVVLTTLEKLRGLEEKNL